MSEQPPFACGHARTPGNTNHRRRCRTCELRRARDQYEAIAPEDRYFDHRVRYLPRAIAGTRRKLAALEEEAARYGLHDLVRQAPDAR